jgi:hypothetical protein
MKRSIGIGIIGMAACIVFSVVLSFIAEHLGGDLDSLARMLSDAGPVIFCGGVLVALLFKAK